MLPLSRESAFWFHLLPKDTDAVFSFFGHAVVVLFSIWCFLLLTVIFQILSLSDCLNYLYCSVSSLVTSSIFTVVLVLLSNVVLSFQIPVVFFDILTFTLSYGVILSFVGVIFFVNGQCMSFNGSIGFQNFCHFLLL